VTGGKIIFLSGQVSVDMSGNPVGVGDIVVQTRTTLDNLKQLLEGAGAELGDVIKLNTYVTNITDYREKALEIRQEYFPNNFPASTLVEVKSLSRPELMIEIEAIAVIN
jgi:enamine deaminase RidA (YjgF/YER057c/UK114 family)